MPDAFNRLAHYMRPGFAQNNALRHTKGKRLGPLRSLRWLILIVRRNTHTHTYFGADDDDDDARLFETGVICQKTSSAAAAATAAGIGPLFAYARARV